MKIAIVQLSWTRSVSDDVKEQRLVLNGGDVIVLEPTVEQYDGVRVPENSSLNVALTAFDGTFESDAATLDFAVGDLSKPQSPSGLAAKVVEVVEE